LSQPPEIFHAATQEFPGHAQGCEFHPRVGGASAHRRNGRGAGAIVLEHRPIPNACALLDRCDRLAENAGEFKSFEGRIDIDFDKPSRSRVDFRVAAKSVDVNSATLDDYLRSEVFLNVARFPDMRFVSTSVEKREEDLARVTGDLTMLGVTRPVSLDVEVARKLAAANQRIGFKATGVINRLDFGMNAGYPLISDAIHLTVTTEASAEP
jgi:polyisoprenoid-binding protein YceI